MIKLLVTKNGKTMGFSDYGKVVSVRNTKDLYASFDYKQGKADGNTIRISS